MKPHIVVALAGNPNSGKTTIFNNLTGYRQHVGNYPGVTVEKKIGNCTYQGTRIDVVDLPGTYSLTAYSTEELVARNYVVDEKPDVVVDVVDASNLERNLYLATQLMELNVPLILAFNMSDIAEARGIEFDLEHLSWLLGAPIVPMVGHKGKGTRELLDAIIDIDAAPERAHRTRMTYGREIEEELTKLEEAVNDDSGELRRYPPRWVATKLLERDDEIARLITNRHLLELAEKSIGHLETVFGDSPEIIMADRRYGFISGACQEAVRSSVESRHTVSDTIDTVLTNRIVGLPIFLILMYLVFQVTFALGAYPTSWLETFFGWMGDSITRVWPWESALALQSLLVEGIIAGVGGVITFLPNILLLFLAIAVLEDTGYMARAAFIMDHLMHRIGLHGKSFIPLVLGFGCSVPAIMATRILDNRRDRLTTMMVVPLMSCGARLPIYALIIPTFFAPSIRAPLLWMIYLLGVVLAIAAARVLRGTILKGETSPLVMELPLYRMPTVKGVIIHMWERGREYVKKAGTVILAFSVIMWVLTSYPKQPALDEEYDLKRELINAGYLTEMQRLLAESSNSALMSFLESELLHGEATSDATHFTQEERVPLQERHPWNHPESMESKNPVETFVQVRAAVESARERYANAIEEGDFEEGSPERAILSDGLRLQLRQVEEEAPVVFQDVLTYLDEIKQPHDEELRRLFEATQSEKLAFSMAGRIGRSLEPVIRHMGFDWRIGTAMIGAFAAKELFVAQIGIVFAVGESDESSDRLREQLRRSYVPLQAFCIMIFMLISMPCMATVAVTKKESGSWRWAFLQLAGLTILAYVFTSIVYQAGSILGIGTG